LCGAKTSGRTSTCMITSSIRQFQRP
jgi:hypothetical protein